MNYKTKLIIALLLVYLVWGSTFLGVKIALQTLPPLFVSGIRFFIAGSLLFTFAFIREKKLPNKTKIINAFLLGTMLSGIGNCTMAYAIHYIPTGIVAIISATVPLWIFILNFLFFAKQKPKISSIIGLSLGIVGMLYLLNPFSKIQEPIAIFPVIMVLIGTISWGFGSLKSKQLNLPDSPLQSASIQMLAGGFIGLASSFLLEKDQYQSVIHSHLSTFLALGYLIFIGTYLGYNAYLWLINNAEPQLAATYAYVNPVVALFLGAIFLHEDLSSHTIIASIIILSGVVLMTMNLQKFYWKKKRD